MDFIILTGMSGAGKTCALHALEDYGYYCVDNLPPALLDTFFDLCENSSDTRMKKVAVVADSRSGVIYNDFAELLKKAKIAGKRFKILFLDASNESLLKRYKETRRKHPLANRFNGGSTEDAIALEGEIVKPIKEMADFIIDTTGLSTSQMRERIQVLFSTASQSSFLVTCVSFGFKYGIPLEADMVLDVRCLPNPFYVPDLKKKTGLDQVVVDYVMDSDVSKKYADKILDFLEFAVPQYRREGKSELVIGIGCTGGKHRSVTFARLISSFLIENNIASTTHHRDIWKA